MVVVVEDVIVWIGCCGKFVGILIGDWVFVEWCIVFGMVFIVVGVDVGVFVCGVDVLV